MSDSPATPRRRGAPVGNKNASKHGFYSRQFQKSDLKDLDDNQVDDMTDEIKLLRVFIRRVIESNDTRLSFPQSIELLRALSLATTSINRLIRTQHLLNPSGDSMDKLHIAMAQMIEEAESTYEMNLPHPHSSITQTSPDESYDSW